MSINSLTSYQPLTINGLDSVIIDGAPFDPSTYVNKTTTTGQTMNGQLTVPSFNINGATASKIPIFDGSKNLISSGVDAIKITYLDNVSSDIQTQLNSKASTTYVDTQDANLQSQINAKASITYVDTQDAILQGQINNKVNKSGDTMTGTLDMG